MRQQAACSAIRLEALDKGVVSFERGHDIAEADFMRRSCKSEAAFRSSGPS